MKYKFFKLRRIIISLFVAIIVFSHNIVFANDDALVPVSETKEVLNGRHIVTRTFACELDDNTDMLDDSFELDGYRYVYTSVVKNIKENAVTKEITTDDEIIHTVDLSSKYKDSAKDEALDALPQTIEYNQDGYVGTLNLVASTISVAETGRTNYKGVSTQTRTYEYQYNDDSLVPNTITYDGNTYTSTGITWSEGSYAPDSPIPDSYIATVNYVRNYTYSAVDGYKATAYYTGNVTNTTKTVEYVVTYTGTSLMLISVIDFFGNIGSLLAKMLYILLLCGIIWVIIIIYKRYKKHKLMKEVEHIKLMQKYEECPDLIFSEPYNNEPNIVMGSVDTIYRENIDDDLYNELKALEERNSVHIDADAIINRINNDAVNMSNGRKNRYKNRVKRH